MRLDTIMPEELAGYDVEDIILEEDLLVEASEQER